MDLKTYLYTFLAVFLILTLSVIGYKYISIQNELKELKKQNSTLISTNKDNNETISELHKQNLKNIKAFKSMQQANKALSQKEQKLLDLIHSLKDDRLSQEDIKFIKTLYPNKESR